MKDYRIRQCSSRNELDDSQVSGVKRHWRIQHILTCCDCPEPNNNSYKPYLYRITIPTKDGTQTVLESKEKIKGWSNLEVVVMGICPDHQQKRQYDAGIGVQVFTEGVQQSQFNTVIDVSKGVYDNLRNRQFEAYMRVQQHEYK